MGLGVHEVGKFRLGMIWIERFHCIGPLPLPKPKPGMQKWEKDQPPPFTTSWVQHPLPPWGWPVPPPPSCAFGPDVRAACSDSHTHVTRSADTCSAAAQGDGSTCGQQISACSQSACCSTCSWSVIGQPRANFPAKTRLQCSDFHRTDNQRQTTEMQAETTKKRTTKQQAMLEIPKHDEVQKSLNPS